jgi:hypothetical protein
MEKYYPNTPPTVYGKKTGLSAAVKVAPEIITSLEYDKCVDNITDKNVNTQEGRDAYNAAVIECKNNTINKRGGSRKRKNKRSKKTGRSKRFRKKFKSPFLF